MTKGELLRRLQQCREMTPEVASETAVNMLLQYINDADITRVCEIALTREPGDIYQQRDGWYYVGRGGFVDGPFKTKEIAESMRDIFMDELAIADNSEDNKERNVTAGSIVVVLTSWDELPVEWTNTTVL
jgi:hypothetical protein